MSEGANQAPARQAPSLPHFLCAALADVLQRHMEQTPRDPPWRLIPWSSMLAAREVTIVVRISISAEAFEVIARTLPLGSVAVEPEANAKGERAVWLDEVWVDRLAALRGPGESYSDVILRLAAQK
jgi:hypothetical protein